MGDPSTPPPGASVDAALVAVLATAEGADGQLRTVAELAQDAAVHEAVVEAIAREGLLVPVDPTADEPLFRAADADAVRAGMALLEAGIPLGELLELARVSTEALRDVAARAVTVFLAYVRDPAVADELGGDARAAGAVVDAFERMLPAAQQLVANHLGRLVLDEARERLVASEEPPSPG